MHIWFPKHRAQFVVCISIEVFALISNAKLKNTWSELNWMIPTKNRYKRIECHYRFANESHQNRFVSVKCDDIRVWSGPLAKRSETNHTHKRRWEQEAETGAVATMNQNAEGDRTPSESRRKLSTAIAYATARVASGGAGPGWQRRASGAVYNPHGSLMYQ